MRKVYIGVTMQDGDQLELILHCDEGVEITDDLVRQVVCGRSHYNTRDGSVIVEGEVRSNARMQDIAEWEITDSK